MKTIKSFLEFEEFIDNNPAALVYFSTPQCNVCKVLKPKIIDFIHSNFSKVNLAYVDCEALKDVSAQNRIFAVPTIIVYLDGREFIRKSRNINITEFHSELERPYKLFFDS